MNPCRELVPISTRGPHINDCQQKKKKHQTGTSGKRQMINIQENGFFKKKLIKKVMIWNKIIVDFKSIISQNCRREIYVASCGSAESITIFSCRFFLFSFLLLFNLVALSSIGSWLWWMYFPPTNWPRTLPQPEQHLPVQKPSETTNRIQPASEIKYEGAN